MLPMRTTVEPKKQFYLYFPGQEGITQRGGAAPRPRKVGGGWRKSGTSGKSVFSRPSKENFILSRVVLL